jgi:hypothetical protein
MKTEKEILEKYKEMLVALDELNKFVENPPEHTGFRTIKNKIQEFNYQSDLCNFMAWILDIKEPHNVYDIDKMIEIGKN